MQSSPLTQPQDAGFDTRDQGTPEQRWRDLLARSPLLDAIESRILIVAPHPDDETFGAGGLQQRHPDAAVLLVTDGEASSQVANLANRRQREVRSALRTLGHGPAPVFLGLPDGHVSAHERQLERALSLRLRGVSTLVAPYEHDGHTDHDAVGRVCLRLAKRHRLRLLRYCVWAWHRCDVRHFRATQFVRLPLSAHEQQTKRRAIACFHSQLEGGRDAVVPPHVLEYFQRPYEAFLS
jgi:LmbE family N-acetylglucosaminyl deacetylase